MTLPPAWKVKRELRRIYEQAKDAVNLHPSNPFRQPIDRIRQIHYDRNLARLLRETPGERPLTQRVAVFVLFQPKGVANSTFLTLDHLAQERWSVLVVSNAPLSQPDRARLAQKSGRVIERPNVGYDFGAYREGWRWLERNGGTLDKLILMNDSAWFPLRMHDDSLRRMEEMKVDLSGQIFKTEKTEDKGRDHLESHLLMFSGQAISHSAIQQFWSDYVMSSNKTRTILAGEKGISQAALKSGLSVKGLLGQERMVELLAQLSDADLLDALNNLALHLDSGRKQRVLWQQAAGDVQQWRSAFLAWTQKELSNSRQHLVSAAFIDPASRYGGMGFLKKSNHTVFQLARLALLRAIDAGTIPPMDPIVDQEVRSMVLTWVRPDDWRSNPNEKKKPLEL